MPNQYGTSVNAGSVVWTETRRLVDPDWLGWRQERTRSQRTQHSGRTRMAMASGTARTATTLTIAQMKMAIPLRTGRAASTRWGRVVRPRRVLIEDGADAVPQVSTQRLDEDGDGTVTTLRVSIQTPANKNQETRRSTGTVARTKTEMG